MVSLFYDSERRQLGPLMRGYLLWFEQREKPEYGAVSGLVLLLLFIVLEYVIGPRASILAWFDIAQPPSWARIAVLLAVAIVAVRLIARVKLADIGFVPPWRWRAAENFYLAQVLIIAAALFYVLRLAQIPSATLAASWPSLTVAVGTAMLWGFYQELIYRGILQTELSRRLGAVFGGLAANLAFTFGPLHFYHIANMQSVTSVAIMMSAIFAIGLVFAFIYARTRNIWLVGLLHGVGVVFTTGVGQAPAP
jgi:membrane protease YdiL (CAAX protease family)